MPLFEERQYSRQRWILLVIGLIAIAVWGMFVQQIIRGKPVGQNPMADWGVWVTTLLVGIGVPALLLFMHVHTVVEPHALIIFVVPFTRRVIRPDEIARFAVREVKPIREYGGWGIRGFRGNRAYLMNGNTGVQLDLKDGKRVFIGSERPAALETALATMVAG